MFFDSRCNSQNVGIKDDVFRWKSDCLGKQVICSLANTDLVFDLCCLTIFIKGHDDRCSAISTYGCSTIKKSIFSVL